MRTAVLSDIHGNLTAFEAVLDDLRQMTPDLVVHGGDLADAGSSPMEIIDRIRDLGWPGVMGNTDEMLVRPSSLETFARCSPAPPALWDAVREIAEATRLVIGSERLAWLSRLPSSLHQSGMVVVHATPESAWRVIPEAASDEEFECVYGLLKEPTVVFAHTHKPFVRSLNGRLKAVVNTGSVGLPYDGDPRASYLLLDDGRPSIRRVEYDREQELAALSQCGLPGAEWTALMLRTSSPQPPPAG